MQQRKTSGKGNKSQKNKSKKKDKQNKKGEIEKNLSFGIGLLLICLIIFVLYYSYNIKKYHHQSITIIEENNFDLTHLNDKYPTIDTKYDHSIASNCIKLKESKLDKTAPNPILIKYPEIIKSWNHDINDFTQGFEVFNINNEENKIIILESTGLYKKSRLKYIELNDKTTTTINDIKLKNDYFGEGCTLYFEHETGNKLIYQLTWKKRKVIIYDLEFNILKEINLPKEMKEGWGIYYDYRKGEFIATDGSPNIYFIEPKEFKIIKTITVKYMNNDRDGKDHKIIALTNLNEIEMVNGWILANVWYNTNIYIISPFNGFVYGIIECWKIFPNSIKRINHAVLNGIAYDSINKQLLITGKNWPKIFAIQLPQFMF